MNRDLARLLLMRRVLASVTAGKGVSASIVEAFRSEGRAERHAARLALLGNPPPVSLSALVSDEARELGMLASLVAGASGSSVRALGRKGETLSIVLEGWLKAKETRVMERRVLQMRGYIMCAVLGAVMAIVSALGPVVGSISLLQPAASGGGSDLPLAAAAMVAASSSMLGFFLSARRFFVNLLVALSVFGLAYLAASPLASVPAVGLWGIK